MAPHPDDEILMAGGLIARVTSRGGTCEVLAVTDGEASHPERDPRGLALQRRAEQREALRHLGVPPGRIRRLGLPDGEVATHERALTGILVSLVPSFELVVAPWRHDHHCDHEATGRAAAVACRRTGTVLLAGLTWAWLHGQDHLRPSQRLRSLRLTGDEIDRRDRALRAHRSQLGADDPVVPAELRHATTGRRQFFLPGSGR